MTRGRSAAIELLAALACTAVQASETYTYDSNPILGFGGGPGVEFTFSFTVPGALADGAYFFSDASAGFACTATDGFHVFHVQDLSAPPSAIYRYPTFHAARLVDRTSDTVQLVDPSNPAIVGDFTDAGGTEHVPQANRGDADASGFWSYGGSVIQVPEPGRSR